MDWALRDLFLAYVARMKDAALRHYETQLLVWAILAPYQKQSSKPPDLPKILK